MVVILERIIEGKLHSVGIKLVEAGMLEVVVFYEYTCKVGTYLLPPYFTSTRLQLRVVGQFKT